MCTECQPRFDEATVMLAAEQEQATEHSVGMEITESGIFYTGIHRRPPIGVVGVFTWPAPREPHKCPGLEERAERVVWEEAYEGWAVRGLQDHTIYADAKHCPECGHDLNEPDPPGAG